MDLEGIRLHKISQRKTNTTWFYLCVEFKKQNKGTNKTEIKLISTINRLVVTIGEVVGEWVKIGEREQKLVRIFDFLI